MSCVTCGHGPESHVLTGSIGKPKPPGPPATPSNDFCRAPLPFGKWCDCQAYIRPGETTPQFPPRNRPRDVA